MVLPALCKLLLLCCPGAPGQEQCSAMTAKLRRWQLAVEVVEVGADGKASQRAMYLAEQLGRQWGEGQ